MNPITIPLAELKPAIAGLGKVIPRRAALPALGCVRVSRTGCGHIELAGTDLDVSVTVQLPTPSEREACTLLVPLHNLQQAVKRGDASGSVAIAHKSDAAVTLKFAVSGNVIEQQCASLAPDEFPPIKQISGDGVRLDERVRLGIQQALECASTDPTRLIINSAFLDVSKPDAHYVVGTDGRHLFSANTFKLPLKESVVIPRHPFLTSRQFTNDGDWTVRLSPAADDGSRYVELASCGWRFVARVYEGNYPNWRQVVPDTGSFRTTLEVEPGAMDSLIQTISRLPEGESRCHTIGVQSAGEVSLLAKTAGADTWTPVAVAGLKTTGKDVRVFLNRTYLLQALRFGLTRIDFTDEMSPLRLSNGNSQMIIMPVRPDSTAITARAGKPVPPRNTEPAPPVAEQDGRRTMSQSNGSKGNGDSEPSTGSNEKSALETALSQIDSIKVGLRDAIAGANRLAELLRQAQREQKSSDKEVQSVRQALRSLQSVRI
jgi:DNA polymerase III sliding clamp (beta) subunit (PCNA family)